MDLVDHKMTGLDSDIMSLVQDSEKRVMEMLKSVLVKIADHDQFLLRIAKNGIQTANNRPNGLGLSRSQREHRRNLQLNPLCL